MIAIDVAAKDEKKRKEEKSTFTPHRLSLFVVMQIALSAMRTHFVGMNVFGLMESFIFLHV